MNWKLSGKYCLRSTFAFLFRIDESANSFTNFFHFVSNYLWFILSRLLIQEKTNNLYKSCSSHLIHINVFIHLEAKYTNHRRTCNFLPGRVNHLPKKFSQVAQISTKQHRPYRGIWRWLDTVFKGQCLSSSSLNYVAIKKHLEKLPPQLYQIKMKICHDQGCNVIGVVKATKWRHYLFYLQQYFSAPGTVLTKLFTFFSNTVDSMFLKLKRNL